MRVQDKLHSTGQSLWLSQVSREMIEAGSLLAQIEDLSITGVAVSPEAVCRALSSSHAYDGAIAKKLKTGVYGKELALELILEDVHYAADLLRHIFDRTKGTDGWAVLPISPLISNNADSLLSSVLALQSAMKRPNMLLTVPGLSSELAAIEEIAFAGISCNIACIYSHDQLLDAADACLRGIERRIDAGLKPAATTFTSIEISRLAASFLKEMLLEKATRTAIDVAGNIYRTMRELHTSQRWERAYNEGARPLRLVWVGPEDNQANGSTAALFKHLVAPSTVMALSDNDMKELLHDQVMFSLMQAEGEGGKEFATGPDFKSYAAELQERHFALQVQSWIALLENVARKSATVVQEKTFSEGIQ